MQWLKLPAWKLAFNLKKKKKCSRILHINMKVVELEITAIIRKFILWYDIENLNFIVSMAKPWNIGQAVSWLNPYIVPGLTSAKNSRYVDPNLMF